MILLPEIIPGEKYEYMMGCLRCRGVYNLSGFARHYCPAITSDHYKVTRGSLHMAFALSKANDGVGKLFKCEEKKDMKQQELYDAEHASTDEEGVYSAKDPNHSSDESV